MADYYETLGVSRNASQDEIKKAYRKLARKLHPDVAGAEKAEEFKAVNEAYDVLSNEEQRRLYDMGGADALRSGAGAGFGGFDGFSNIFETFFGAGMGGGRRGPVPRGRRGQDAVVALSLELKDVVFGVERDINVTLPVECPQCHGSCAAAGTEPITCNDCGGQGSVQRVTNSILGQMVTQMPCPTCQGYGTVIVTPCQECDGRGRVRATTSVVVKVPAGVEDGMRIRLAGKGEAGVEGGLPGDLFVEIRVKNDAVFQREGDDLLCELEVPMTAAALGCTLDIDTFDGPQSITVPEGTDSGHIIALTGLGVGHLNRQGRGELKVAINVKTPNKLEEAQRALLEQLAQLRGEELPAARMMQHNGGFFSKLREKLRS